MPRIPPAREGNPSLSPTTTISGSRAPTHPHLISAVRCDPTVTRGTPPAPGAADSPDGRPPMAVTHLDEAGYPLCIH